MTFKQFIAFATVARHLNVTRASAELRVSQPSLSKHLKQLQEAYKVKLYYRKDSGGIELTDEGRDLLKHVNVILSELEKLKARFKPGVLSDRAGSLRVGGSYSPSAILLPSIMVLFKKNRPGMATTLRTHSRIVIERLILRNEIDLAVISRPSRSPSIVSEPYRGERLVAFASPTHPLATKRSVTLEELALIPLIIAGGRRGTSIAEQLLRQLERDGYKLNIAMRFTSTDSVKTAVQEKYGIGILYEDNVQHELKRGDFKQVRFPEIEKLAVQSYIIYRKDRPLSSHAEYFRKLLVYWLRRKER